MARLEAAVLTSGPIAAGAVCEFLLSGTHPVQLLEIGVSTTAAQACTIGIGRPAAAGITPGGIVNLQHPAAGVAGSSALATSWGTAPTSPTTFWRRYSFPASVGASVVWTFPAGQMPLVNANMVLYLIVAPGVTNPLNVYFAVDEGGF